MKSTRRKALLFMAAVAVAAAAAVGLPALEDYMNRKAWEKTVVAVYPMANQNITWTGAGYNGIWGKGE